VNINKNIQKLPFLKSGINKQTEMNINKNIQKLPFLKSGINN
jgi:hypothetical protein